MTVARLNRKLDRIAARIERRLRTKTDKADLRRLEKRMNQRFGDIDKRFGDIDKRFGGIDKRFGGIDKRFGGIDKRLDDIDQRLKAQDGRFAAIDARFDTLEARMALMEKGLHAKMDVFLDNHERRLQDLEAFTAEQRRSTH